MNKESVRAAISQMSAMGAELDQIMPKLGNTIIHSDVMLDALLGTLPRVRREMQRHEVVLMTTGEWEMFKLFAGLGMARIGEIVMAALESAID